jgi:molecular chaperone GrpE (heat shock protein)
MVAVYALAIAAPVLAICMFILFVALMRKRRQVEERRDELEAELEEVRREARSRIERAERESRRREQQARWEAIETILPAIDSLESADRQDREAGGDSLGEGISMTLNQFESGLADLGIERIHPAPGESYRPRDHEALHVYSEGDAPDDPAGEARDTSAWRVRACTRSGYRSDDRVLRPAGVVVEAEEIVQEEDSSDEVQLDLDAETGSAVEQPSEDTSSSEADEAERSVAANKRET